MSLRSLMGLISTLMQEDKLSLSIYCIHLGLCFGQFWLLFFAYHKHFLMLKILIGYQLIQLQFMECVDFITVLRDQTTEGYRMSEFVLDKIASTCWTLLLMALLTIQIGNPLHRLVLIIVFILSSVIKISFDIVNFFSDKNFMMAVDLGFFVIVFSILCFLMAYIIHGLLEEISTNHGYSQIQDAYFRQVINQQTQGFIVI